LERNQYEVEPREFEGRLLHQLPPVRSKLGDAYAELYLAGADEACRVAITKSGTRVIADIGTLPGLEYAPWTSRYLQGLIDVPYLNLTPGTRSGIVHDERYSAFVDSLTPLEAHLNSLIEEQRRAEEEQANAESLRAIQRAFREAMLVLPREEYDWFEIRAASAQQFGGGQPSEQAADSISEDEDVATALAAAWRRTLHLPGKSSKAVAHFQRSATKRWSSMPRLHRASHVCLLSSRRATFAVPPRP
jgi:hypothetical protein